MDYVYCILIGLVIGSWLEELNSILDKQYLKEVKRRKEIKDKIFEVLR